LCCRRKQKVDALARRLRRQVDSTKPAGFGFLDVCEEDAERSAGLTEAQRTFGFDAAVSLKLQRCGRILPFLPVSLVKLKQSLADDSRLDEDVVGVQLAPDGVAVFGRRAMEVLVAAAAAPRLHVGHPEVVAKRAD
jgi:hypothetical protein